MLVRELFQAHQWFPDKPHPAVATSVLESGMSRFVHAELAERLRAARGAVGILRVAQWDRWAIVEPGDWIISRPDNRNELVKRDDFPKRFEILTPAGVSVVSGQWSVANTTTSTPPT
jgi:hypothetical protein